MSARRFSSTLFRLALAATFVVAGGGLAFAQSDFNESTIPPSAPPSRVVSPPSEAEPSEARGTEPPADQSAPSPVVKPSHPANIIPYTVRPGDSVGAIAQVFGITADWNSPTPTGFIPTRNCRWTRC